MVKLKYGIGLGAGLLMLAMILVGLGGFAVFAVVGAWDLLVRLTNSDWKTTEFAVPTLAIMVFIVACGTNKVLGTVLDWAEREKAPASLPGLSLWLHFTVSRCCLHASTEFVAYTGGAARMLGVRLIVFGRRGVSQTRR